MPLIIPTNEPGGRWDTIQREAYDWALTVKAPLGLQRAAAAQAHTAFQMLEQHWKDWAGKAGQEQDEKVSGRLLRGLLKKPRPITSYLRSHPSSSTVGRPSACSRASPLRIPVKLITDSGVKPITEVKLATCRSEATRGWDYELR